MARGKALAALALLAGATLALAGGGQQGESAADLLRKSMGRRFPVNVVAVILQRDPAAEGTYQRVKVARAKDGKARHTVLQPLRMAGVEQVDDGELLRVYLPDRRSVIVQDSPQKESAEPEERIAQAKRNYVFSVGGKERIAGRTAVRVVAEPKADDMAIRRYYLDEKSGYPLRLEVVGDRGELKVIFDTVAIEFPDRLNRDVFAMNALPGTETIRYTRPKTLSSRAQAQAVVGFRPILPERIPYGFNVQEMQYNPGPGWKSVVIRLTDGLVRATVYQWKPNGKKIESVEDSSAIEVNGIRLMIVSDLPAPVRMRILQSFVGQAKSEGGPQAIRLIGALTPAVPCALRALELAGAVRTFADLDHRVVPIADPIELR